MMDGLVLHPTETAQWHALVNEAEGAARRELGEELQSYLVFLLMRFIRKPQIANSILATQYLESMQGVNSHYQDKLRNVGDQCLLYSGLFPHRAERKQVKISYFVDIGRSAYLQLGSLLNHQTASVYQNLAYRFVNLMDVLHAMRAMDAQYTPLSPLQAMDLWEDTGSQAAYDLLKRTSPGTPMANTRKNRKNFN